MKKVYIIFLVAAAIISPVTLAYFSTSANRRTLREKAAEDYAGYGDGYAATALSLIHRHSFVDAKNQYFGAVPTGPTYALFLAGAFLLGGENMRAVWIIQILLYVCSVLLLYRLSAKFLAGRWALAPPLFLALFWGAAYYVLAFNNEVLSLFLAIAFFLCVLAYFEHTERLDLLVLSGLLLALLILAKPIFEYFAIVMLGIVGVAGWRDHLPLKKNILRLAVFSVPLIVLVGGWHLHNYTLFGTPSISTGGHALYIHALSATYETPAMKGFFVSSLFGDFVADRAVPGYSQAPEPATTIRRVFSHYRLDLKKQGLSEFQVDKIFWKDGFDLAKRHPVGYGAVTAPWFFRLNNIPSLHGGGIEHMFVGTYPGIPDAVKLLILMGARLVWFGLILGAFWAAYRALRERSFQPGILCLAVFMLYLNGMYSVFAHAEVRYALPAIPFYALFVAIELENLWKRPTKQNITP